VAPITKPVPSMFVKYLALRKGRVFRKIFRDCDQPSVTQPGQGFHALVGWYSASERRQGDLSRASPKGIRRDAIKPQPVPAFERNREAAIDRNQRFRIAIALCARGLPPRFCRRPICASSMPVSRPVETKAGLK